MRSTVIAGCIVMLAATTLPSSADATTMQQCKSRSAACDEKCSKRSIGKDICYRKCDIAYMDCIDNASNGPGKVDPGPGPLRPKGTGGHTPPTGGAKDEPKAPPKVNDTRAPTGGVKGEPKAPPKVNDTRAPIGGGVFGQKPTPPSGGSGTILMKSGGASGPSFRSNGGRR